MASWWVPKKGSSPAAVDVDDGNMCIDLTSDTEDAASPAAAGAAAAAASSSSNDGVEVLSPWALQMQAKQEVKNEGLKRAAEAAAKAQQSGEVQVTDKPAEKMNEEVASRPAKRSKGGGGEEDMEVVGTTGTAKLPHNRFACTELKFEGPEGSSSHKEKCSLCYCYVCDRLASQCVVWYDHCHATDSGPRKVLWKSLRTRAKPLLQAGRRPPVSGRFKSNAPSFSLGGGSGSGSHLSMSHADALAFNAGPSGSSSGGLASVAPAAASTAAPAGAALVLPNDCNCEDLCKPIHQVFRRMYVKYSHSAGKPAAAAVYLNALTQEQVQHVEDISIQSTLDRAVQKSWAAEYPSGTKMMGPQAKATIQKRFERNLKPTVRVVAMPGGRSNVTVAALTELNPNPLSPKWTAGSSVSRAVRLGAITGMGFRISGSPPSDASGRKEYFDRFVSPKPIASSVWHSTKRPSATDDLFESGRLEMVKKEDAELLEQLKRAYDTDMVDIEASAAFSSQTNTGCFTLEIILLSKTVNRGTSLTPRTGGRSTIDMVPLVERCVLNRMHKPNSSSSSSSKKKKKNKGSSSSSSSSAGALTPVVNGVSAAYGGGGGGSGSGHGSAVAGREFTPSNKGYGGRASLDVSLSGLIDSVRDEEGNDKINEGRIIHPARMLMELENLQHRSLVKQPDCLTVDLYEHQKQDAQWMMDQEMLQGGSMQHLWAELPAHRLAPLNGQRINEFRRCWFSPILNQFTANDPFASTMKGGILCDEMGLGKTAATLCLHLIHPPKTPAPGVPLDEEEWGPILGKQAEKLAFKKSTRNVSPESPGQWVSKGTLVVCKVSLVGQWVEEAKRLCGGTLKIYPYHGGGRRKDPAFLSQFDMVVTTYGVVQADGASNGGFAPLRRIRWWRVVLDESHTIAASNSTTTHVKTLVSNRRWCMTGTPYISRFSDVNGQLAFLGAEGAFRGGSDLGDKAANALTQGETVAFLRRVLLRHSQGMKLGGHSILGLPNITHKVEVLTLPSKERKAYVEFEQGVQNDYVKVRHRLRTQRGSHTMEVLTLLSKFRQACSGGQLVVGASAAGGGGGSTPATLDAFCSVCNEMIESPVRTRCGHTFCQACISSVLTKKEDDEGPCPKCKTTVRLAELTSVGGGSVAAAGGGGGSSYAAKPEYGYGGGPSSSGGSYSSYSSSSASSPGTGVVMETKLKALVEKLAGIHAKDPSSKSLVFSQFNSSLEWLKRTLPKKGFQFRTLTGNMSRTQRTAALTAFANDPPTTVFLLSVRSGAVGINLTQANNVFLLEPLLNLALEKQAIGRVYRLGQARHVTVTKLVLKDSIETRILALQKKQAAQGSASAAVGAPSSSSSNGVAGNIARDNAKDLKIGEYNALFGVSEEAGDSGGGDSKPHHTTSSYPY